MWAFVPCLAAVLALLLLLQAKASLFTHQLHLHTHMTQLQQILLDRNSSPPACKL
jgi:hypothetical protein